MQGNTEQHQLTLISQLCGSIAPDIWPGVDKLDLFTKIELPKGQKRKVKERLHGYVKDQYALDLLDKLLTLDPSRRVNSDDALNHDFFWVEPLPQDLNHMLSRHNKSMFEYLAPPRRRGPIQQQQGAPGAGPAGGPGGQVFKIEPPIFKYLGSFFTKDGRIDREIEVRCQKANSISYQFAPLLKNESIPIATKAKLVNSIFLTTLTYQCQTWPLTQVLKNKLVTCEMRCLRKAVNKTRRDKIRNETIRAQVGATPVLQHVENQQIKWFGHLMRMPTDQPAHWAYNSRYSGKRPRGRPRRRWSDSVADILKGHNKSLCETSHLAVERR
ncbi:cyclin-dependent kinase 9 [Elysia marginata]|uniref:Cyclin-dependent kinase 9 n=1 Tax=Elysia marginata TaxID=1093978 RepID=A0AAV4EYK3_9GAST|nr:cyclin-dependent kinase 9 [Elysia marginata]